MQLIPNSDPILRVRAPEVDPSGVYEGLPVRVFVGSISEQMFACMEHHHGIGLAAPQIGLSLRMFVMRTQQGHRMVCINPSLVQTDSSSEIAHEGCLSWPGEQFRISRASRIKVAYLDRDLNPKSHYLNRIDARCFQHELDHLDGITPEDREKDSRFLG